MAVLVRDPGRTLRTVRAGIFWAFCGLALAAILIPSVAIVISVIARALPVLKPALFTTTTSGTQLGLQNAILGTLVLSIGVLLVAGPVGLLGGLYLAEFAPPRTAALMRFFSELLAGVPSIVIGYIGYIVLVIEFHWGFSLLGGVLALSALVLPYIVKTTEVAFAQVPRTLREAATALGLSRWTGIRKVLLRPALPAIISGLVIAMAISTGETAPLLYTAGFSDANPSMSLFHHPIGYLTYVTYTDVQLPGADNQALAGASAALTIVFVLLLVIAGRLIARRSRRSIERMDL